MTTLQDVMQTLMAWQNRSLRTLPEIDAYMRQIDEQNEFLIVLYQAMQLDEKTKPNAADRALVKQWTEEWWFAQMFVLGCAPWAAGKKSPMAYLNKMLKVFREKELNLLCFFLWRFKRVPVFMAGALLIFRSLLENGMGTFSIPKRIEK